MASITEKVKEGLVGADVEPTASDSTRSDFMTHAVKDEETGEYYMGPKEFIDAVAPEGEDYVRMTSTVSFVTSLGEGGQAGAGRGSSSSSKRADKGIHVMRKTCANNLTAQDQA